ncbi:MAG: restriction endonuclease, partial [candidate division Zixibacteria bacterium]|nr:restriction endonuclease [candidate division Zixibacteria bacterium]NIR63440.1 restriction endonuclease [candidate division Zixibacteria bacterium]NIS16148.1 restriction endonuclease [candidate division Zixibacteria bacterium]NIS45392.1 restriction endonuclease [candidate division Zixibacteria bacterium]NIT53906.1 restriction endonuclease [candidate division Zixibacteria bacterium]
MALPKYYELMLPLLKLASDEKEHYIREAIDKLAETLHISEGERKELLPSGKQAVFDNRAGWARTYMAKAGLLENTRRGYFRITQRGLEVLQQNPAEINT